MVLLLYSRLSVNDFSEAPDKKKNAQREEKPVRRVTE